VGQVNTFWAFLMVILLSPILGLWWYGKGQPDKAQPVPRRQRWHQVQVDPMIMPKRQIRPSNGDPGRVSRDNREIPAELRNMFGPPQNHTWNWLHENDESEEQAFKLFWKDDVR
jgi:hypothetical protein